ncbi:hypothetical protein [Roseibacillus persicicus]|uniref:hypothetical protein n=1 Tax=Roseibacillus persicicus TaxID=454148 RepID=UPI00280D82C4|nr:hypothetical protein [Roseibacillus persicicus]MDQ8190697.1 hypothetical protein [Roseibacillus persicicus]
MAVPLKLVLFGPTAEEVSALIEALAGQFQSDVAKGEVAGASIYRFTVQGGESAASFALYAASQESDFRGVFETLATGADGLIALIPADLSRIEESRRTLGHLHRGLTALRNKNEQVAFLLQYHSPAQATGPSVPELDQALGVNPNAVQRAFSQEGQPNMRDGLQAILQAVAKFKV